MCNLSMFPVEVNSFLTHTSSAYPTTAYEDYPSKYSLCGTIATSIGGIATCLTYEDGCDVTSGTTNINSRAPTFTYPSHPPLSEGVQEQYIDLARDPRGWTFLAVKDRTCGSQFLLEPLFPGLGLWDCSNPTTCVGPDEVLETALFLTATSTSTEADPTISASAKTSGQHPDSPTTTATGHAVSSNPIQELPPSAVMSLDPNPTMTAQNVIPAGTILSPIASPSISRSIAESSVSTVDQPEISESASQTGGLGDLPQIVLPTLKTYINAQGKVVVSTALASMTPIPAAALPSAARFIPEIITSTDKAGKVIILTSNGNPQGESTILRSFSTAQIDASESPLISFSNAQGSVGSGKQNVPSIAQGVTDAQGYGVPTISSLLKTVDTNSAGSQISTNPDDSPAVDSPSMMTTDAQTMNANSHDSYVIGSQTLVLGGVNIATGATVSLFPHGTGGVVGQKNQGLTSEDPPDAHTPPALTIGTQIITPNAQGHYIIESQALLPGEGLIVSGTPVSLASSGANALIESVTKSFAITTPPALTIGTQVFTADAQGQYVVNSQTLTGGDEINVSGTLVSLASGRGYAIVGTSSENLGITTPPPLAIGTQVFTANSLSQYVVDGQTLTPGGAITASGTRVSLAPGKTDAVIGTSTEGLGGYIMGGFGRNGGSNGSGVLGFTGRAVRSCSTELMWMEGITLGMSIGIVLHL